MQPVKPAQPKLIIQQEKTAEPTQAVFVERPPESSSMPAKAEAAPAASVRPGRLDSIRKQIAGRAGSSAETVIALEQEKLKHAWNQYMDLLKENKNPAEQSFKMATLNILGDSQFEVITNNNLEQKFIEQEKRVLSEYLQKHFCNKTLHFAVKITEHPVEINFGEKTLSKKEQFMLMVQQYPLVKELKDRLKLELDY